MSRKTIQCRQCAAVSDVCPLPQPYQWASWWSAATATWRPADSTSTGCRRRVLTRILLATHHAVCLLPLLVIIISWRLQRPLPSLSTSAIYRRRVLWGTGRVVGGAQSSVRTALIQPTPVEVCNQCANSVTCLLCLIGPAPGTICWPQGALPGMQRTGGLSIVIRPAVSQCRVSVLQSAQPLFLKDPAFEVLTYICLTCEQIYCPGLSNEFKHSGLLKWCEFEYLQLIAVLPIDGGVLSIMFHH